MPSPAAFLRAVCARLRPSAASPAPGDDLRVGDPDAGSGADAGVGGTLRKTAAGAGWTVGWRMTTRLLGLVNSLILGNFLGPADFGIVILATGIVTSIDLIMATGVSDSLVRKIDPSADYYDSAFTIDVAKAVLLAVIVFASAPYLADVFHDGRLGPLLRVLCVTVVLGGFESIRIADLRRDMEFRREFMYRVGPRVLSIVATVAAVLVLRSYWALVVGIVVGRVVGIASSYVVKPYRPRFSFGEMRDLLGFSSWTAASGFLQMASTRGDSFLLGWLLNASAVGNYAVGFELASIPTAEVVDPLCRVCFSAFAEERRSAGRARETYVRIVSVMLLLTLPAGVGVALMAAPLVCLSYGSAYAGAIPVLQMVGLSSCFIVLTSVSATLFQAHGYLGSVFRLGLVCTVVQLAFLAVLIPYLGLPGAGFGILASRLFEQSLYGWVSFRRFGVSWRDVASRNWRGVAASLAMAAALPLLGVSSSAPIEGHGAAFVALMLGVLPGVAVYCSALWLLWLASGRPGEGPEGDALALLRGVSSRVAGAVRSLSGRDMLTTNR